MSNKYNLNVLEDFSGNGFQFEKVDIKKSGRADFILSYHCMNEVGYYMGYAYFRVVPLNNDSDYKIHFIGKNSSYLNRKYLLRDFIEDTIHYQCEIGRAINKIIY